MLKRELRVKWLIQEAESEADSNFAINVASDFDSESHPESDSDHSSSAVMLWICSSLFFIFIIIFLPCIYVPQENPADNFLLNSHSRINSYNGNSRVMFFFRCFIA